MDSGFYAACTGLLAQTDALEVTANNLANLNTPGYKGQMEFYRALEASSGKYQLTPLNQAVNNYGVLGGTAVDLKAGEFQKTGNELDLALEGEGFFTVKTKTGMRYTRNGNFHIDPAGNLQTSTGDAVMGTQGPVQLPGGTITISSDGTISQGGAVVASLNLVTFGPGTSLTAEGSSYYQAAQGTAQPATDPRLAQGRLRVRIPTRLRGQST